MSLMFAGLSRVLTAIALLAILANGEGRSGGPPRGTLVVDGGAATQPVVKEFVRLAGGPDANIVVIPTGASSLRFGLDKTILDLDWPRDRPEWTAYETYSKNLFGVSHLTILHTRDRKVANSDAFVEPLRHATGVFLGTGNAGRHAAAYLETKTQSEPPAITKPRRREIRQLCWSDHPRFLHRPGSAR